MQWFRFYSEAMRDTKVCSLADKDFRLWVELLCVACDNEGTIPPIGVLKRVLNRRLDYLSTAVKRLLKAGLIIPLDEGYEPNGWRKRQYKSDSSTPRVQKHREKCNVSVTDQRQNRDRTDITLPNGNESETSVSDVKQPNGVPYKKIGALYTKHCPNMTQLREKVSWTDARKTTVRRAWLANPDPEWWEGFFEYCGKSKFLSGMTGERKWKADLFWLLKPENFAKINEGKYHGQV